MNSSTRSSSLMSSPSNSIADSSMTASSAKIGASALHRERDRVRRPRVDLELRAVLPDRDRARMNVLSRSSVTQTRTTCASSSPSAFVNRSCVSGRGVRLALELHEDRGRLRLADPDREVAVPVGRLQQHDRLLAHEIEAHPVDDHLRHRRSDGSRARGARAGRTAHTSPPRPTCAVAARYAPSEGARRAHPERKAKRAREEWAIVDSNHGPPPYQSGALTD